MVEYNAEELSRKFQELKAKGGKISLEDIAGKELIEQAAKNHNSRTNSIFVKMNKVEQELLVEYHEKAKSHSENVSPIGEFINSDGEKCTGFKISENLIFFDIQSYCICVDENYNIHEIAIYEIEWLK